MSDFPFTLAGEKYTKDSFEGIGYYSGVPAFSSALVRKIGNPQGSFATGSNNVYPGKKFLTVEPYAPFFVGMRVLMVGTGVVTSLSLHGRVLEYDAATGYLVINAQGAKNYGAVGSYLLCATWYVRSLFRARDIASGPLAIANNGTNAKDYRNARANLLQGSPGLRPPPVLEDFIGGFWSGALPGASYGMPYPWSGTGTFTSLGAAPADVNHNGVISVSDGGLGVGPGKILYGTTLNTSANNSGMCGNGQGYAWNCEWNIYLPVLSTGTNGFTLKVGVGTNVTSHFAYLTYTDTVNAGQWVATSKAGSGTFTSNTASAVAATTWYKIKVYYPNNGTGIHWAVNGVDVASSNAAPTLPFSFHSAPLLIVSTTVGAAAVAYVDYMQFWTS